MNYYYYYLLPDEVIKDGDEYILSRGDVIKCFGSIGKTPKEVWSYHIPPVRRKITTTKLGNKL